MPETKTRPRRYIRTLEKRLEEMLHGGAKVAARFLSRLEEATQPPHRTAPREPHTPAAPPPLEPRPRKPGVGAS